MPLWPCACIACPFLWIAYCTSIYSCISIGCISFRYARWTTRGREARDGGTEPQDGVGGHILKREGPAGATEDPTQGRKAPRPC